MNKEVKNYIDKYPDAIKSMFCQLRELLLDCMNCEVEEKLWAKLPSYYVGGNFVRLIPFKDHINVEAKAVAEHFDMLDGYKLTPKGMIQIYLKDALPVQALENIFTETLSKVHYE